VVIVFLLYSEYQAAVGFWQLSEGRHLIRENQFETKGGKGKGDQAIRQSGDQAIRQLGD
jgi:hypothetical protein